MRLVTRREVVQGMAALAASAAAQACGSDGPTGPAPGAGTFRAPLPAVGATVNIPNAGEGNPPQGVAVTRTGAATVVAFSRRCTHEGCTVGLPPSAGANLTCPCHGSVFTAQGQVVSGPAPSSLRMYPAVIDTATNEVEVTVS